jgi:hypothetical protein
MERFKGRVFVNMSRIATSGVAAFALLYSGTAGATAGPSGQLAADTTLTLANSPYVITGDLEVMPGVTLTIEPGVVVQFQTGTDLPTGWEPGLAELIVDGTLLADGPPESPVRFMGVTAGKSKWSGLQFSDGAEAALGNAIVTDAFVGIRQLASPSSTIAIDHVTVANSLAGVHDTFGNLELDAVTIHDCSYGVINIGTAVLTATNLLVFNNLQGFDLESSAQSTLFNSTVDNNGISVSASNVVIKNSIISGGASAIQGTAVVTYSDIWGAGDSPYVSGVGCFNADPLFVGASDYELQPGSPAIDSGDSLDAPDHDLDDVMRPLDGDGVDGAEWDMGAYEAPAVDTGSGGTGGTGGSGGTGGTDATGGSAGTGGSDATGGTGGTDASGGTGGTDATGGSGALGGTGGDDDHHHHHHGHGGHHH